MKLKVNLATVLSLIALYAFSQTDPILEYLHDYAYEGQEYIPICISKHDTCFPSISIDTACKTIEGRLYDYNDTISLLILSHPFYASDIITLYNQSDKADLFKEYIFVNNDFWNTHAILNKKKNQIFLFSFGLSLCAECTNIEDGFDCIQYMKNGLIEKTQVGSLVLAIGFIETYTCYR